MSYVADRYQPCPQFGNSSLPVGNRTTLPSDRSEELAIYLVLPQFEWVDSLGDSFGMKVQPAEVEVDCIGEPLFVTKSATVRVAGEIVELSALQLTTIVPFGAMGSAMGPDNRFYT